MGFQPVLAHPECYLYLNMDNYQLFKDTGCLFQRNVGSFKGPLYGPAVNERAKALVNSPPIGKLT